ncbi:MAG: phospholipase D-like domain-containing protein [Promethearchaeota archaeon]
MLNFNRKLNLIVVLFLLFLPIFESSAFSTTVSSSTSSLTPAIEGTTQGQQVIDYFRQVFNYDWKLGEEYDFAEDGIGEPQSSVIYGSNYDPQASEQISGTMKITPILSPDNSESQILSLINSATKSLDIEQMYIYDDLTDIVNAIISAYERGVTVRVILDDANNEDSKATADLLTINGITVKICTGTVPMYFDTQHNKGVIVDGTKVLISSINWSPTSFRENREAGLIIESVAVAAYYQELFDHDWSVCELYDSSVHLQTQSLILPETIKNNQPSASLAYINQFSTVQTFEGEMIVTCMASPDNCYSVVANLLRNARYTIYLSVYTLSSPYLIEILRDRIANGVKVKLLLEKYQVSSYERDYNRDALYRLTVQGVKSKENPSEKLKAEGLWASQDFTYQHCKYCIIDNKTLILSSGNWARSSCPKPQDDGDVDGNRDWWIAIYGSNPGEIEETLPFSIPFLNLSSWFLIIGIVSAIMVIVSAKKITWKRSMTIN